VESHELRRERDGWSSEYVYFVSKPKQFRHALLLTDFYTILHKQAEIKKFIIEPKLDNIRPDAIAGYVKNGQSHIAFVEVEISNKGFDAAKYRAFDWHRHFPIQPELIVITDHTVQSTGYATIAVPTDLQFIL